MRIIGRFSIIAVLVGVATSAEAQWVTQEIPLQAGWNAVCLFVDPDPSACSAVAGNATTVIDEITTFNDAFSSVQFIKDIGDGGASGGNDWLRWSASPQLGETSTLANLIGGRAYLVHTTGAGTWNVQGIPVMRTMRWRADSMNLVGFPVSAGAPPTFSEFFADCGEVNLGEIYRMASDGTWTHTAAGSTMQRAEAFWIETVGLPDFQGPVALSGLSRAGLDYGQTLVELPMTVTVEGDEEVTLQLQPVQSENSTNSSEAAAVAGNVPMLWWNAEGNAGAGSWDAFTNQVSVSIDGPDERVLTFAANRREFEPFAPPGGADPVYVALVNIMADTMMDTYVPVRAVGTPAIPDLAELPLSASGLWVGSVAIGGVSRPYPADENSGVAAVPDDGQYTFRVLLHCSTNGTVSLLSHVTMLWQEPAYGSPDTNGYRTLVSPAEYRLVGDQPSAQDLAADNIDLSRSRRISSTVFSHVEPLAAVQTTTDAFRFVVPVSYDDPRSPFKHAYHPMHDNRINRNSELVPKTVRRQTNAVTLTSHTGVEWISSHVNAYTDESVTVTRSINMTFGEMEDGASAEWGVTRLGGEWQEAITGLHAKPLQVRGTFVIERICDGELE